MSTINFTSGNILGNEELVQNNVFLRKSLQSIISNLGVSKGVVKQRGTGTQLLVNVGTNTIGGYNTLKVNAGDIVATRNAAARDAIIDSNVMANLTGLIGTDLVPDVCSLVAGDNIQIPNIGTYNQDDVLYVGVYPYLTVLEEGTVNVSTAGQVTFSNANVTKRLRSHVSNSPTKIRIYQNESASPVQQKEFEVVSIDSDTTITIDGVFPSALTDYRVAIVGSYDLIESPSLVNRFAYASVIGRLAFATTLGGFAYDSVPIAKITFNTDQTFTITDLRDDNLFYITPTEYYTTEIEIGPWNMAAEGFKDISIAGLFPNLDIQKMRIDAVIIFGDPDSNLQVVDFQSDSRIFTNSTGTEADKQLYIYTTPTPRIYIVADPISIFEGALDDPTINRGVIKISYKL